MDETTSNMREAIAFHLEGLAEDGDPMPEASGPGIYVDRNLLVA